MEKYLVSRILYDLRKECRLSQDTLCYGLCSKSFLSKVEKGMVRPSYMLTCALFYRMGQDIPRTVLAVTESDRTRYNLSIQISAVMGEGKTNIKNLLDEYAGCSRTMDKLEKQYYALYTVLSENYKSEQLSVKFEELCNILRITLPEFEMDMSLKGYRLTREEMVLINNISGTLHRIGVTENDSEKRKRAVSLMDSLIDYDREVFENKRISLRTVFKFNETVMAGIEDNNEEMARLSLEGIYENREVCNTIGYIRQCFNLGNSYVNAGKINEAEKYLDYSLSLMAATDCQHMVERLVPIVKQECGLDFSRYLK